MTQQNQQVAAAAIVEDQAWLGELQEELRAAIAPVFAQARSRLTAFAYVAALLAAGGDRRSCWQLAEAAGHGSPRRMQALLGERAWDWKAALKGLQRFILAHLADPGAILVLDETAELKKGTMTAGVSRQHAGITGQVENCQTVVFCAYVTAAPTRCLTSGSTCRKPGAATRRRRERAQVPAEVGFATKTELGMAMAAGAVSGAVPFGWGHRQRGLWPGLEAAGRLRDSREGICARRPVRLPGPAAPTAGRDAGGCGGAAGARRRVGHALVRAGLQGPPRLPLGPGQQRPRRGTGC